MNPKTETIRVCTTMYRRCERCSLNVYLLSCGPKRLQLLCGAIVAHVVHIQLAAAPQSACQLMPVAFATRFDQTLCCLQSRVVLRSR
jgi:hypothetical protein